MSARDYFEGLFARAGAPSSDLRRMAGEASKLIPSCSPKRKTFMEGLSGVRQKETVRGKETRVARKGQSGAEALGAALAGLGGAPELVAMYSFAMDWTARPQLFGLLRERTAKIAKMEQWPECIQGGKGFWGHFHDDLVALTLDMDWLEAMAHYWDQEQPLTRKPYISLHATLLGIGEDLWRTKIKNYHDGIEAAYAMWQGRARGHVERGLIAEFQCHDLSGPEIWFDSTNPAKSAGPPRVRRKAVVA